MPTLAVVGAPVLAYVIEIASPFGSVVGAIVPVKELNIEPYVFVFPPSGVIVRAKGSTFNPFTAVPSVTL